MGYVDATFVMVNYVSVANLIRRAYGDVVRLRMSSYSSDEAFLADDAAVTGCGGARVARYE
jgi:hypothetical protein